jgi:hypothetical protein
MTIAEQRDRYRRQATVCYEIAVTLTGEKASAMTRLGDAYATLALPPRPDVFVPHKYVDPLCRRCGTRMRLIEIRSGADQPVPAFRCAACGEIQRSGAPALPPGADDSTLEQHHVVASFVRAGKRFAPGPAVECPDADTAVRRAELMLREEGIVGAVAFSRRVDLASGAFRRAIILKAYGEIPKGFDIA